MKPRLSELRLGGTPAAWERLGFTVGDGEVRIGAVRLRFAADEPPGIAGWALTGADDGEIDGLPTRAAGGLATGPAPAHPNGASHLDHVVVLTPDLERTMSALEATGLERRRVREAGGGVRQAFYRLGEVILEVAGDVEPPGPAHFWGLVVVVSDLDALAARLGDGLSEPRDAVQPGRRIATLREAAGAGPAVAFMTPERPET